MRKIRTVLATAIVAVVGVTAVGSASPAPNGLSGSIWLLTGLKGKAPVSGIDITSQFTPAGDLSGSAGCNSYGARYKTSGATIKISAVSSTRMACRPKIMA